MLHLPNVQGNEADLVGFWIFLGCVFSAPILIGLALLPITIRMDQKEREGLERLAAEQVANEPEWYEEDAMYDPDRWKPCANPRCQAPIPRRARRMYCDRKCRTEAERLERSHDFDARLEEEAAREGYDEIPF
jgi:hypothetical protein